MQERRDYEAFQRARSWSQRRAEPGRGDRRNPRDDGLRSPESPVPRSDLRQEPGRQSGQDWVHASLGRHLRLKRSPLTFLAKAMRIVEQDTMTTRNRSVRSKVVQIFLFIKPKTGCHIGLSTVCIRRNCLFCLLVLGSVSNSIFKVEKRNAWTPQHKLVPYLPFLIPIPSPRPDPESELEGHRQPFHFFP